MKEFYIENCCKCSKHGLWMCKKEKTKDNLCKNFSTECQIEIIEESG